MLCTLPLAGIRVLIFMMLERDTRSRWAYSLHVTAELWRKNALHQGLELSILRRQVLMICSSPDCSKNPQEQNQESSGSSKSATRQAYQNLIRTPDPLSFCASVGQMHREVSALQAGVRPLFPNSSSHPEAPWAHLLLRVNVFDLPLGRLE